MRGMSLQCESFIVLKAESVWKHCCILPEKGAFTFKMWCDKKNEKTFVCINCQLYLFLDWSNIEENVLTHMVFLGCLCVVCEEQEVSFWALLQRP